MKFLSPIDVNGYISLTTQNPGVTPTKFLIQDANGRIAFRTGQELKVDIGADYTEVVRHTVKASVAINKGQAVYTIPTQNGTNILVGLASNDAESTSSKTLGLLDATVAINGVANVVTQGLLAGLNTATATIGDPVWLGTNGNLIYGLANKPYAPAHLVFIGIVTRVNLNNGEIFIRTQNGFELDELHDVDLKTTTPINGHILGYNGTLWVNKTIASWLGFTPANDNNVVHKTGTETIDGVKTFSSAMILNSSLNIVGGGYSILYNPGTTGYWQNYVDSSNVYNFGYNGTNVKAKIDTSGNFTANSFIKSGGTASQFLKADGSVDSNSYLSSITNAMVVAALGYTPYSNTNPNNYISGITSSMVTTALGYTPISSLTDTLATVTARGAITNGDIYTPNNGGIFFNGNGVYGSGIFGRNAGQDLGFNAGGTQKAYLNASGDFTANASLRSPIFYDSNNTGYYVDPASTSTIYDLTLSGAKNTYLNVMPGNGYEAMTRYYGGTANYWYTGNRNTSELVGTADYHIYSTAAGRTVFGVTATGYATAYADFRAPIFYDSNNTSYYVDPASTSYLNSVDARGFYTTSNPWGTGNSAWMPNGITTPNVTSWLYGTVYLGNAPGNGSGTEANASGDVISTSSHRAAIFYDYNNTGYYMDPASTSNVSKVKTNAGQGAFTVGGSSSNFYPVVFGPDDTTVSWHQSVDIEIYRDNVHDNITAGGTFRLQFTAQPSNWGHRPFGVTGWKYKTGYGTPYNNPVARIDAENYGGYVIVWLRGGATYYYKNNSQNCYAYLVFDNASGTSWTGTNGVVFSTLSSQDYYFSRGTGIWSEGKTTFTDTPQIYGDQPTLSFYSSTSGRSASMYLTPWDMRIGNASSGNLYLGGSNTVLVDSGAFQAPLMYDINNTGFYVDPASLTQLNTVRVADYIGRNSYSSGYFVGGQNNIGATDGKTNPIYVIGTSYMPADTTLNNMYGIGYSHTNFWGGKTPSWGIYIAEAGSITATVGNGIWTSGDVTAYSDARVKDNIEVITDAISKIKEIRGVTFTRNDASEESKDQRKTGVIAQEVLKVLPEAVSGDEENMYSVAYGNMVGLLIEGIKEQQTQIEELKQLLNHLINK